MNKLIGLFTLIISLLCANAAYAFQCTPSCDGGWTFPCDESECDVPVPVRFYGNDITVCFDPKLDDIRRGHTEDLKRFVLLWAQAENIPVIEFAKDPCTVTASNAPFPGTVAVGLAPHSAFKGVTREQSRKNKAFTVPRVYPSGAIHSMQIFFNTEYAGGIDANCNMEGNPLWHESSCASILHEFGHALGASHGDHCPIMMRLGALEDVKEAYLEGDMLPETSITGMNGLYHPSMPMCENIPWVDPETLPSMCRPPGPIDFVQDAGCSCQEARQNKRKHAGGLALLILVGLLLWYDHRRPRR